MGEKYRKGFVNAFVFIKQMWVVPFHFDNAGVAVSVSHTTEVLLLVFDIPRKCYC